MLSTGLSSYYRQGCPHAVDRAVLMLAFMLLVGLSVRLLIGYSHTIDGLFSCCRQGCSYTVDRAVLMLVFMLLVGLSVGYS